MAEFPSDPRLTLDLLVPWELPLDQPLTGKDRECISEALRQLVQALQEPVPPALQRLDQALDGFGDLDEYPVTLATTNTPLRVEEVTDYDRYFGLQHVHAASAAICLVRGLLVTCQIFLTLCDQASQLSPEHIKQQKQGFQSYVSLLVRVFHLTEQDVT